MLSPNTIFFDLDNTLYDHTRASNDALQATYTHFASVLGRVEVADFCRQFHINNDLVWQQRVLGEITDVQLRVDRFKMKLENLNLDVGCAAEMSAFYLRVYQSKPFLLDGARDVLDRLSLSYPLAVISNGFSAVQRNKMAVSGILAYFAHLVVSEDVGSMKPAAQIFEHALGAMHCPAEEALFVGDSYEADMAGAKQVGMKTVWFCPSYVSMDDHRCADYRISELRELTPLVLD